MTDYQWQKLGWPRSFSRGRDEGERDVNFGDMAYLPPRAAVATVGRALEEP